MICPSCNAANDAAAESCFTCGHALATVITRGTLIASRYEILTPLGRGGMGVVYKAHDRALDETVAIKILRPDVARDADLTRRFRSEIKLARKVSHRNVCRIHEWGEDGGLCFISMELMEGVDLRRQLRERGAFSRDAGLDVMIQAAKGLQAIHDVGIVHRDLKTGNIMCDAKGVVRLMDFGIAKQWGHETTAATASGHVVGTPEYMSPEQARGEKVDARSDLYALGVVAFELFSGELPFKADTPLATLLKHLHDPPPLEGPAGARIPVDVLPVIGRLLAKARDDRYASAREVAEVLRGLRGAASRADAEFAPTKVSPPTMLADATPMTPPPTTPLPTPTPAPVPKPLVTPPTAVQQPATTLVPTPPPTEVVPASAPAPSVGPRPAAEVRRGVGRDERPVGARRLWLAGPAALAALGGFLLIVRGREFAAPSTEPMVTTTAPPTMVPSPATAPSDVSVGEPAVEPSIPTETKTAVHPSQALATSATPRPPPAETRATPRPPTLPPSPGPAGEKAPAPAPEATIPLALPGTLVLDSTPAAAVALDGQPRGRTPATLTAVSPGRHTLALTTDDGRMFQEEITLASGATLERTHRFPGFGSLSITSDVWLDVSVDGGPSKSTPRRIEHLVAGHHAVRASRAGFKDKTVEVEIREGETYRLNIALEPEPGGKP